MEHIDFLDRPPLEWSVNFAQYHAELKKAEESRVRYVLIKTIMEIERCLKVQSPLQKAKVNMLGKLFGEVSYLIPLRH